MDSTVASAQYTPKVLLRPKTQFVLWLSAQYTPKALLRAKTQFVLWLYFGLSSSASSVLFQDVARQFEGLDECSAFAFENFNQKLKRMVKSGRSPLAQITRRILEGQNMQKRTPEAQIKCTRPNNVFGTDQIFFEVIEEDGLEKQALLCRVYDKTAPLFTEPCDSRIIGSYVGKAKETTICRMITYTVVEFEKEKTVAIVCRTWIVANGNVLSCYWPSSEPTKKAKNGELPDKKTWKLFKIRIIEKSFTSNYEKAVKYLRRAEELSNVETDGDTQIKKRAHKRPSRFESDTEDECVTPAKRPRFQCLAGNRPQAPVFTENRQEHEPLPQVTSAMPYQNGCQVTNEEQNYLTLNRKIDEVIRELRQFREIIMQQQQQVVEEQAHVEQMQTEEELSAFCSKLNEERSFRKSMIAFSVRFCSGTVGQSVRRMMRAFGTNMLWSNFSLKGRKGKKVFQDLPIMRLITRACLQTFKAAKMAEIEGEVAECLKHAPHKRGGPKNLRIDVHRAEDDDETQIGQSPCLFDSDSD
ncbi:hypothetical protein G5714_004244 [Onychostoma macrolepis]|uniref:DUF4806 domain-containing protein n=1 Tax=Onychostoma macrolepis TaxID=369639 RepID=A0A7J6D481_9TELE|nr:hypothetical protein G5714_004244 [Onychostoma macrolepis]